MMIYISRIKDVKTLAAAAGVDVDNVVKACISDEVLSIIYSYDTDKNHVDVKCRWNLYICESLQHLKVQIGYIELDFNL